MRNPTTTTEQLQRALGDARHAVAYVLSTTESVANAGVETRFGMVDGSLLDVLSARYGLGEGIVSLGQEALPGLLADLKSANLIVQRLWPGKCVRLDPTHPHTYLLLLLVVCFDEDGQLWQQRDAWLRPDGAPLLFDVLLRAFVPGHPWAAAYKPDAYSDRYCTPVLDAIALPAERRAAALGRFMQRWGAVMKPYGYRDTCNPEKRIYDLFPFHVALAVCAYDIDDNGFRSHPQYPRELVDHYRARVRHRRDAWRPIGLGAPGPLPVAPHNVPKKVYALKPAEAYAQWLHMACAGDASAVAQVHAALRKRRTMPGLFVVVTALAAVSQGLQADTKDDETLSGQVRALCAHRGLAGFVAPASPPAGAARIEAILAALGVWLKDHGQCLCVLDDDSDAWLAVVVAAGERDAFLLLCEQLNAKVQSA